MATINSENSYISTDSTYQQIVLPAQVSFCAFSSAIINNVTGDGTLYTPCVFDTELLDIGNNFAGNTFTAPVTGIYLLNASVQFNGIDKATHTTALLSIVTTTQTFSSYTNTANWASITGTQAGLNITSLCSMTAGNTAYVQITISGGTKTADYYGNATLPYNMFSGTLLC